MIALNRGGGGGLARCPRFVFDTGQPKDLNLFAEALPKLVGVGLRVPLEWAHEKLRIPLPRDDEEILQVASPPNMLDPELRPEPCQATPKDGKVALAALAAEREAAERDPGRQGRTALPHVRPHAQRERAQGTQGLGRPGAARRRSVVALALPLKEFGCKCAVIPLSDRQLGRMGATVGVAPEERYTEYVNPRTGETQRVPAGVHPAFNYPPGGRLAHLGGVLAEKVERAPAAIGAAVFRYAAPDLPVLMQGHTGWVNAIEAGGGQGLGGRRVIGAVSPAVVSRLADAGIALESAGISITQREVTHLFAEDRKSTRAVPREWVYALPERLANPDAVIRDATPGKEAILYVWKIGDRYVRVAVRHNFGLKGKAFTNAVRSAQIVPSKGNLQGPMFTVLEGAL